MRPQPDPRAVFLNIPYDEEFQSLYLAYIAGLYHVNLIPHLASEIPGSERRLNRIFALIQGCRYSIHDLSRVELSVAPTATPRFNMPLELGMTITWANLHPRKHAWFVWEAKPYRLQQSASDLNGTDPYVHGGTAAGVLREIRNAFVTDTAPTVKQMLRVHRYLEKKLKTFLEKNGTRNPYDRSVFRDLCWTASTLTAGLRPSETPVRHT